MFAQIWISSEKGVIESYSFLEWMINYNGGLTRRGLSGELAILLQSLLGGQHWYWAYFIWLLATLSLFHLAIRIYRFLPDDPALLPLILCPAGLLFAAYDPEGSIRKEVIGFIAILLVLNGGLASATRIQSMFCWAGIFIFAVGIWIHEAIVFLLPCFIFTIYLAAGNSNRSFSFVTLVISGLIVFTFISLWFLLSQPTPNIEAMCAAVEIRACEYPFKWLEADVISGIKYVIVRRTWTDRWIFAIYALLAVLPFMMLRIPKTQFKFFLLGGTLSVLGILPLFILGYDWGRWIQMIFLPLCFVAVYAIASGTISYQRILPAWFNLLYLGSWHLPHAYLHFIPRGILIWPALGILFVVQKIRNLVNPNPP